MRIVVCVKRIYDPATIKISRSREELDLRAATYVMNPPDKYALEAALRLRSALGGEVIAVSVGGPEVEDTVREAIAIGADHGLVVAGASLSRSGGAVTRALVAAIEHLAPVDLVLTGQAGLVDGTGSLPARLAAALGWPVALDVARLTPGIDGGLEAAVTDGREAWALPLACPAVTAIQPGPERPRYPHAARIANAWQPGLVEVCGAAELGLSSEALVEELEPDALRLPPERVRGQVLGGSVGEAAGALLEALSGKRMLQ